MNRLTAIALTLGAANAGAILSVEAKAQNSTKGCGSPIVLNSTINRLELVCNKDNADLARVVERLNELARRQILTPTDLRTMAAVLNAKIDKISNDTDEILLLMREVLSRLDIASSNPGKAPTILRPYLDAAIDITNRRYDVNEFLDVNGKSESRVVFRVQGNCQVFVTPPRGTGFTVGIGILSDRGSPIWRSLQGTQGRYSPQQLSTGTYQFVMVAKRGAGQYSATIASRCD